MGDGGLALVLFVEQPVAEFVQGIVAKKGQFSVRATFRTGGSIGC